MKILKTLGGLDRVDAFDFDLTGEPTDGGKHAPGGYSNGPERWEPADDFSNGDNDGAPGGRSPSRDEIWGTGDEDIIDETSNDDAQKIYGFAGDDDIQAGGGNDTAYGGLGDDIVQGGGGDDTVVGDDGDDNLLGNSGNDDLHAGHGADVLIGGWHDDTIYLIDDALQDSILFEDGDGNDIVDNFELGVDKVFLSGFGFGNFAEIDALITYNIDGDQALLDLGGGDSMIFTKLDGSLTATDFGF